jgi:hypothetical protein
MPQTDATTRKAKPESKHRRRFGETSSCLEPPQTGGKPWGFKYRIGGKEGRPSPGIYPVTDPAVARTKRDTARKLLAAAVDPAEQREAGKSTSTERSSNSFERSAREWITHAQTPRPLAKPVAACRD